jgi:hypothetical protein
MRTIALALLVFNLLACHRADTPPSGQPRGGLAPATVTRPRSKKMTDDHAAGLAANPPGIRYEIRFADGKSRFVQGEPIRLELAFSSSLPGTYRLDGGLYDRIGRLSLDTYVLDPDDAVDPLADYFEHGLGGMGGLRNMPVLGDEPSIMVFELNEWKRFDHPGHYWLYVQSARIEKDGQGRSEAPVVTSNMLELDIEAASPDVSTRAFAGAVARLDQGKTEEDRRKGARALRFLGTEAAAMEMIRRFGRGPFEYELQFGLIGSPHRAAIVKSMEARLDEDAPATLAFVRTLALLRDKLDHPGSVDRDRRRAVTNASLIRLAGALGKKSPANRAVCVSTLLELGWENEKEQPAYLASALAAVPGIFRDLPPELQSRLVEHRWRKIKGPAMLPVFRAVYDDPATSPDLRESVLHRLLELDPADARARILAHLRTGSPPLGVLASRTLAALPDTTLPELDAPLADRLEKSVTDLEVEMLARYATASPLKRIQALYTRHASTWATTIEGHFLGYFLRVDPAFGARAAKAVLEGKRPGAGRALAIAAKGTMTPALEALLILALDAADVDTVVDAAEALRKHGTASAEAALWKRLTRFHAEWKDRGAELRYSVIDSSRNMGPRRIETALWNAIAMGRRWLTDKASFAKLGSLVVSESEKEQVANRALAWTGKIRLDVTRTDGGEVRSAVAQYDFDSLAALEAKLSQFPRGTAFTWHSWAEEPGDFARIKGVVEKRGMTLER